MYQLFAPGTSTFTASKGSASLPTVLNFTSTQTQSAFSLLHNPSSLYSNYYNAPNLMNLANDIIYHGGAVMTDGVHFYNIYYGDFSNTANSQPTSLILDYLAAHIGGSPWFNIMSSYYWMNPGNGQKVFVSNYAAFLNSSTVAPTSKGVTFTQESIERLIWNQITRHGWPVDSRAIYTVFFRGDFVTGGWLTDWCGYHSAFSTANGTVRYAVVGDASTSKSALAVACLYNQGPTTPNGNVGADSMASVFSHEIAEIVTDYMMDAWFFSSSEFENGDMCLGDFGTLSDNFNIRLGSRKFLIQRMWLPGYGCAMSNDTAATSKAPTISPTHVASSAPFIASPTSSPSRLGDIVYHSEGPVLTGSCTIHIIQFFSGHYSIQYSTV